MEAHRWRKNLQKLIMMKCWHEQQKPEKGRQVTQRNKKTHPAKQYCDQIAIFASQIIKIQRDFGIIDIYIFEK